MGAIVLGVIAGVVCFVFCSAVKNAFGYDDALDVFGVHCVGGIIGAILTGILVNPKLGGTGIMDYATGKIADYDFMAQIVAQTKAVGMTLRLVRRRHADHPQGDRRDHRAARRDRRRARRPRSHRSRRARLQHVRLASPLPHAGEGATEPRYGWGGDPAPPPPSRGLGSPRGLSLFWHWHRAFSSPYRQLPPILASMRRSRDAARSLSRRALLRSLAAAALRPQSSPAAAQHERGSDTRRSRRAAKRSRWSGSAAGSPSMSATTRRRATSAPR